MSVEPHSSRPSHAPASHKISRGFKLRSHLGVQRSSRTASQDSSILASTTQHVSQYSVFGPASASTSHSRSTFVMPRLSHFRIDARPPTLQTHHVAAFHRPSPARWLVHSLALSTSRVLVPGVQDRSVRIDLPKLYPRLPGWSRTAALPRRSPGIIGTLPHHYAAPFASPQLCIPTSFKAAYQFVAPATSCACSPAPKIQFS